MSEIHVQQIKATLSKLFGGSVDLSDQKRAASTVREQVFNTRALAALVPYHFDNLDAELAGACVTDGTRDNGIDSVHYNSSDQTLTVTQSKWRDDGRGSIETGDLHKLIAGFKDLINLRTERFNEKFSHHAVEIKSAVENANTRFSVVFISTGQEEMSEEAKSIVDSFLREMNEPTEIVTFIHLKQGDVHNVIARNLRGNPIDVEVQLFEWAMTREPFVAYYGQVASSELARWYKDHHNRLFAPNLRFFLGATDANLAMVETITKHPEHFWYFNNGVTAVCDSIRKKPLGGSSRDSGTFECKNLRVVNGAQTIGSLATGHARDADAVGRSRVLARFISLENCPPDFALAITRGTNTQNRIEFRDFAALDPEQRRLADELSIDQITYAYKSGEQVSDRETGFDLLEATVALACSDSDPSMAVQAKREIGRLWEDISKPPYKALFNSSLSGRKLWRLVQIQRAIDEVLKSYSEDEGLLGRLAMIPVHGNRVVAHLVFRGVDLSQLNRAELDIAALINSGKTLAPLMTDLLCEAVQELFPDSYLASLFKNGSKCDELVSDVLRRLTTRAVEATPLD